MPSLLSESLEQASGLPERKEEYGFKVLVSQLDYFLIPYSDCFRGQFTDIQLQFSCFVIWICRDAILSFLEYFIGFF